MPALALLQPQLKSHRIPNLPPLETALDQISNQGALELDVEGVEIQLEDLGGLWRRSAQGPRGWTKTCCLAFGLPLPAAGELVEVQSASRDPRFSHWSRDPSGPEFHFFAAVPIHGRRGERLGALCVTNSAERAQLSAAERRLLVRLARRCAVEILARRELADRLFPIAAAAARTPRARRSRPAAPTLPVWTPEEWIADCLPMTA